MKAQRTAVIGDVGGHVRELKVELERLGADWESGTIPSGLTIVQVGDLIHKGPASDDVIALVERFRQASPDQWVQLIGNHEAIHIKEPIFSWPRQISDQSVNMLRQWWHSGWMHAAWAVPSAGVSVRRTGGQVQTVGDGWVLLTHAGLTHGRWSWLGSPGTALEAALGIEVDARERHDWSGVWEPGVMLTRSPNMDAGVVWAAHGSELIASWRTAAVVPPFHQAHGHTCDYSWREQRWREPMRTWLRTSDLAHISLSAHVDTPRRIVRVELACSGSQSVLYSTDPGHSKTPVRNWESLLV